MKDDNNKIMVTLPLPPKELSPNARPHWRSKAAKKKWYRRDAMWAAKSAMSCLEYPPKWDSAAVICQFYFRDKRRRDGDNLLASMKAAFDGLVDADLLDDDSGLIHYPVVQDVDRHDPRVVITIMSMEPQNATDTR